MYVGNEYTLEIMEDKIYRLQQGYRDEPSDITEVNSKTKKT